jgi:acetylornithine deacetylase/succinyl-diaminopimelate desuccinylase-like protein
MHGKKAVLKLALAVTSLRGAEFSGAEALAFTKHLVSFGPRPSGSEAIRKTQSYILGELKAVGCQVTQDDFTGSTPLGQTRMKNIIARFPGKSGKI